MKKIIKALLSIIVILILIIVAAFAYLNFVYLPQKVKSVGPEYLEEKSKGQVLAGSIQYIPFKGVKLKNIAILTHKKEPIFTIEKLYVNVKFWPLLLRRDIEFRLELYPRKIKEPFIFKGLYQIKQQNLDLDFQIENKFFIQSQTISGKLKALLDRDRTGKSDIDLAIGSPDFNLQSNLYIEDKDLYIEKFSGNILDSRFDFIGDVQNLTAPSLNIYGNLDLDLGSLKKINPEYIKALAKLKMEGRLACEVYIASHANNPEIGLKMSATQIKIARTELNYLSLVSKMENKQVSLSKLYAKLYGGEINLAGDCRLDSPGFPTNLNLNIFNLDFNRIVSDITGKDFLVHGRLFSLGQASAPLKKPREVEAKLWLSVSGSNILELPLFKGIADVLRLPELSKIEFKEASGNFIIAEEAIRTRNLNIASNNIVIYYKGYMDFKGDLGFDIQPSFSQKFLRVSPNIGNILGVLIDSAGNFLGEIKMKGNIKKPRYTFKPISVEKIFPKGIEEGLKQLFKLRKKEEKNQ